MSKRNADLFLITLTVTLLSLGGLFLALCPAPRYAMAEKRMLAAFPHIDAKSVLDGSVSEQLDHYATERAPFRGACRYVWGGAQLALMQRESHDVLLCRDGSLSARTRMDKDTLTRNLSALTHVQRTLGNVPLTLAVAPTRLAARRAVLPASMRATEEYDLPRDAITFPDCRADEEWYRTDHHWTTAGAYLAYVRLGEALGYTPSPRDAFQAEIACERFLGTSAARAGLPFITPDHITLWRYEGDDAYTVTRDGSPTAFDGLYDKERIAAGDPYAVFLGGNCGVLEINKGDADARPCLLIIRDSFAAPVLPFLARHYRIIAVDPRYAAPSLSALAARADTALVLCGAQTLGGEPFLTPLLRK